MNTKTKRLAVRLAGGGTFIASFTKVTGERRLMRFRLEPSQPLRFQGADHGANVRAYDLDKEGFRTLRLDAIEWLGEIKTKEEVTS